MFTLLPLFLFVSVSENSSLICFLFYVQVIMSVIYFFLHCSDTEAFSVTCAFLDDDTSRHLMRGRKRHTWNTRESHTVADEQPVSVSSYASKSSHTYAIAPSNYVPESQLCDCTPVCLFQNNRCTVEIREVGACPGNIWLA